MPNPPVCKDAIAGNIFIKHMTFEKKGDQNHGHCHTYDHFTLLSYGSVEFYYDGRSDQFKAPHVFLTKKGIVHRMTALEDGTVISCIHVLRDRDKNDEIISSDSKLEDAVETMKFICQEIDEQTTEVEIEAERGLVAPASL